MALKLVRRLLGLSEFSDIFSRKLMKTPYKLASIGEQSLRSVEDWTVRMSNEDIFTNDDDICSQLNQNN